MPGAVCGQPGSGRDVTELAASVKAVGVLQALLVTPTTEAGIYEIVCGERRWTAANVAGWATVPAVVRVCNSAAERREDRVIENIPAEGDRVATRKGIFWWPPVRGDPTGS